jgi:hypothetical protein
MQNLLKNAFGASNHIEPIMYYRDAHSSILDYVRSRSI